ncbi:maleylpyruvate isomerase N-terminal domain-containing protein [Yinghuangia sp. YIM S09857]|uniref:maleylpyruvate isomerase N-terminal domain-containing protein n=1 Tax=Yinghuangia sp. YIM S09857 TaxID=3436929 RepID=UPI003F52EBF8
MNTAPLLLERAVGYALSVTRGIPPALLSRPTPCRAWDLAMLLAHANESLAALAEGLTGARVALDPADAPPNRPPCDPQATDVRATTQRGGHSVPTASTDPLTTFRRRARDLPGLWATAPRRIAVADRGMPAELMAAAGALEIAVHGWDIARSCRRDTPIPAAIAVELLSVGMLLVPENDRHPLFAPRTPVATVACPSDRLVAYLGRDPG